MRIIAILSIVLFAASTALAPGVAVADDLDVGIVGCTPSMENVYSGSYVTGNGWVANHPTSLVTLMRYYCPMPKTMSPPTRLFGLFERAGSTDSLSVTYYKFDKNLGVNSMVASGVASGIGLVWIDVPFSDTYDTDQYVYYVEFTLERGNGAGASKAFLATVY